MDGQLSASVHLLGILRHWIKHVSLFLVKSQWVAIFLPRDSLSNFLRPSGGKRQSRASSPLGLPKEFAEMEQKLQEMHTKEDDSIFSKSPVPFA
jgi:hypothetical protein